MKRKKGEGEGEGEEGIETTIVDRVQEIGWDWLVDNWDGTIIVQTTDTDTHTIIM